MDREMRENQNQSNSSRTNIEILNNMEILKNLIIVFPIKFSSDDVLFSERFYQCEDWPALYYHSDHENAFETYKEILSNCTVIDKDLCEVFSFDTTLDNEYDIELGRNFFRSKVKKEPLPSYLFDENIFMIISSH